MFSKIMVSLGVVIPSFVDGMQLLRCFFTKKYTLEVMEEFVDSEVLKAVRQRIAMVKIERTAKVEELHREALQRKKEQMEQAWQRKKKQKEQALQRKKEQEEQAPKARGKVKSFNDRMEDLKRFKETHGHANVTIREDIPLGQFCAKARHAHNNPGKEGVKLTDERIAAFDAIGFIWTLKTHVTRSFDERIEDLKKYKKTHGHVNVNRHEDSTLYQFCADVRHSLKHFEKDGTRKLTVERMTKLSALGFEFG
jgi:ATPase subunit of ABC transporter with duplicated ATPase domains